MLLCHFPEFDVHFLNALAIVAAENDLENEHEIPGNGTLLLCVKMT